MTSMDLQSTRQAVEGVVQSLSSSEMQQSGELLAIANANMWIVPLVRSADSDEEVAEALESLLPDVISIVRSKWNGDYCLYFWYDEVVDQLRFSCIPGWAQGSLPFRGEFILVEYSQLIRKAARQTLDGEPDDRIVTQVFQTVSA